MADNKKSFVLYADLLHTFKYLSLEQRGMVFTWILEYVNDMNPEPLEGLLQAVAEPIKLQLKRDLKKYEDKRKQWSEAGKRSAEARKVKKKERTLTTVKNVATDLTVTVNDNVNVNVNVTDINKRKADFKKSLLPFLEIYDKELLKEFFEYWTEHGEKDRKFRKEKEKSFNPELRLKTWFKRQENWKKEKSSAKKEKLTAAQALRQRYGINNI